MAAHPPLSRRVRILFGAGAGLALLIVLGQLLGTYVNWRSQPPVHRSRLA